MRQLKKGERFWTVALAYTGSNEPDARIFVTEYEAVTCGKKQLHAREISTGKMVQNRFYMDSTTLCVAGDEAELEKIICQIVARHQICAANNKASWEKHSTGKPYEIEMIAKLDAEAKNGRETYNVIRRQS